MNITIILNEAYPHGMAATNRIHLYARRFKERGHNVEVIVPRPTERHKTKALNFEKQGEYEGIKFRYPVNPIRSQSFVKRRFNDFISFFNTLGYIATKKRNTDILLLVDNRWYMILTYKLFSLIDRCKFVLEISEFPFVFAIERSFFRKIYINLYIKHLFKVFDGLIVISDSLYDYFVDKINKRAKQIIVPIITNTNNFKHTQNNSGEIVYTGALNQFKDGIMDLLQGYTIFTKKNPGKKLVLMGDLNVSPNKEDVIKFIDKNKMQDSIEITGYVDRPVMIERMTNAAVLALAKPNNLQSEHCFPTKIAEYLSTGKPVLTTSTGSIPQYLTDRKDSFLTEPNDPDRLAQTLSDIFADYGKAEIVGQNGRKLAQIEFDYTTQVDRIITFFDELMEKEKQAAPKITNTI
ncbi:glycosyltransferase [Mucilaginibacter sp. BT774]|uniref:glycosyltransferase n=1 Tax=Mucilaginibacter sp. BT774 TaxID=3062276 RepID=UPI002676566B|nr:glycosyltransferase [Mucilaginibacter sp. BT774]MDO3625438.1 glycosyltransferase [Mucilaginibacter sp. BT774]